jgi:hypothetical protein
VSQWVSGRIKGLDGISNIGQGISNVEGKRNRRIEWGRWRRAYSIPGIFKSLK